MGVYYLYSDLAPTAIISYTLGLRHAIDADHIVIIDLVTRRLVASGQKPVAVGTFFSLGHSTYVCFTYWPPFSQPQFSSPIRCRAACRLDIDR